MASPAPLPNASPVILLHPDDNVLVCRAPLRAGAVVDIDGRPRTAAVFIDVGHKIARTELAAGDRIYKYGAPIGSMTLPAAAGEHVHMHNMKSDYLPSHTRESAGEGRA